MQKLVFVDIETTHLDTNLAVPIQIAAIAINKSSIKQIDEIEIKIDFNRSLADIEALSRNCYNPNRWKKDAVSPDVARRKFSNFCKEHATWDRISKNGNQYTIAEMGGHNADAYDAPIISKWYRDVNQYIPLSCWRTGVIDTMHMAKVVEITYDERWDSGFSLRALCDRFRILLKNEHDALEDVRATVDLYRQLYNMIKL
jgi:DNA polymerase III alpha subunit (gram-positive type)